MERPSLQLSVTALLLLVACVAFNLWLFRLGPLLGIIGLNLTKHVAIAGLCQIVGVNRRIRRAPTGFPTAPNPLSVPAPSAPSDRVSGQDRPS